MSCGLNWCLLCATFSEILLLFTYNFIVLITDSVVVVPTTAGKPLTLNPSPRYYRAFCPHSRRNTAKKCPYYRGITAVTAVRGITAIPIPMSTFSEYIYRRRLRQLPVGLIGLHVDRCRRAYRHGRRVRCIGLDVVDVVVVLRHTRQKFTFWNQPNLE